MTWLLLTQNSVCTLCQLILVIVLTLGSLQLKNKSRPTKFLIGATSSSILMFSIFFVANSVPALFVYLDAFQFVAPLLCLLFLFQFAYNFPQNFRPRESRAVWILSVLGLVISFLMASWQTVDRVQNSPIPVFVLPIIVGVIVIQFIWLILVLIRQSIELSFLALRLERPEYRGNLNNILAVIIRPIGRAASAARAFAFGLLIPIFLSGLVFMFLTGSLNYDFFIFLLNLGLLLFLFVFTIVYSNNAPEPTTVTVKLVISALITVLAILGTVGFIVSPLYQADYQRYRLLDLNQVERLILLNSPSLTSANLPTSVIFITTQLESSATSNNSPKPVILYSRQPEISGGNLNPDNYLYYEFTATATRYRVGFSQSEYFDFINQRTSLLIYLILGSCVVVLIIFPFFFRYNLVQPLNSLLAGVKEVNAGKLNTQVAVLFQDEIGFLTESFNKMTLELKDYTQNLEGLVQQRTFELEEANHEIGNLNQRLEAENLRMKAELEITRRLQQMILPKENELSQIDGLDIAGYMEPADEVGGDYYDVLKLDGRVKIGIGDITGHGLESGVLMIMVQTAVRALLSAKVTDPTAFLAALNRTIYDNVRRMDSEKSLSLALLDYRDGQLILSGQHEETIVVRQNGQVEMIDTIDLGFPIGLEEDISSFIAQKIISLNSGDVVILYSDGIPEAQNPEDEFYGLDRLSQLSSSHRQHSAAEIQQAIIQNLREFISTQKVYDDISLLVIKKN